MTHSPKRFYTSLKMIFNQDIYSLNVKMSEKNSWLKWVKIRSWRSYIHFRYTEQRKRKLGFFPPHFHQQETQRKAEEALAKALADARAAELERARKETEANNRNTQLYREHLTRYSNAMNQFVNNCSPFCGPEKLWRAHEIEKNNSLGQVWNWNEPFFG